MAVAAADKLSMTNPRQRRAPPVVRELALQQRLWLSHFSCIAAVGLHLA